MRWASCLPSPANSSCLHNAPQAKLHGVWMKGASSQQIKALFASLPEARLDCPEVEVAIFAEVYICDCFACSDFKALRRPVAV
jgi:hypothetical protein